MRDTRVLVFVLLGGFLVLGVQQASGIFIYTAAEVEAVNGTDVKLKCIFSSSYRVSPQSVTVSWTYKSRRRGREQSVLYYNQRPYPPTKGKFRKRVVWSGDVMKKDASITLLRVVPKFEGTYTCQVHNIPDYPGRNGEILLTVVNSTRFDPTVWLMALFNLTDPVA